MCNTNKSIFQCPYNTYHTIFTLCTWLKWDKKNHLRVPVLKYIMMEKLFYFIQIVYTLFQWPSIIFVFFNLWLIQVRNNNFCMFIELSHIFFLFNPSIFYFTFKIISNDCNIIILLLQQQRYIVLYIIFNGIYGLKSSHVPNQTIIIIIVIIKILLISIYSLEVHKKRRSIEE